MCVCVCVCVCVCLSVCLCVYQNDNKLTGRVSAYRCKRDTGGEGREGHTIAERLERLRSISDTRKINVHAGRLPQRVGVPPSSCARKKNEHMKTQRERGEREGGEREGGLRERDETCDIHHGLGQVLDQQQEI